MNANCGCQPATAAIVHMAIANNATWEDAFRFGVVGDTTWSFTGQSFIMEVKATRDDTVILLTLSTANARIVVDDAGLRVLHFLVPQSVIEAALHSGTTYVYDLVMFDASVPPVRVLLMTGTVCVDQGVTQT